jgi:hypothetical protein
MVPLPLTSGKGSTRQWLIASGDFHHPPDAVSAQWPAQHEQLEQSARQTRPSVSAAPVARPTAGLVVDDCSGERIGKRAAAQRREVFRGYLPE